MCKDVQLEGHGQVDQQGDILDWHATQAKADEPGTPKTSRHSKAATKSHDATWLALLANWQHAVENLRPIHSLRRSVPVEL